MDSGEHAQEAAAACVEESYDDIDGSGQPQQEEQSGNRTDASQQQDHAAALNEADIGDEARDIKQVVTAEAAGTSSADADPDADAMSDPSAASQRPLPSKYRAGFTLAEGVATNRECCGPDWYTFRVRRGPDYRRHKEKQPSAPPMFDLTVHDIFVTKQKTDHVCQKIQLPPLPRSRAGPRKGIPPFLVVNVQLPSYDPPNPLWGSAREDGPGYSFVYYWMIKEETQRELAHLSAASAAVKLMHRFYNEEAFQERLKFMCHLSNLEEINFGFAMRRLLLEYNDKPVLTRPEQRFYTDHKTYFEIDLDVHIWQYISRKAWCMARPLAALCRGDFALVFEAHSDEEMPEQVAAEGHFCHVELDKLLHLELSTLPDVDNAEMLELYDDDDAADGLSLASASLSDSASLQHRSSPSCLSTCSKCGHQVDRHTPIPGDCPHEPVEVQADLLAALEQEAETAVAEPSEPDEPDEEDFEDCVEDF